MKRFILALAIVFIGKAAFAECCEQPKPSCEKSKVKYITKVVEKIVYVDKIVYIDRPVIVEQEKLKVISQPMPYEITKTFIKKVQKKNMLSILGGTGPTKLSVVPNEVHLERGPIIGGQYQRFFGDSVFGGIQIQSNQTFLGVLGYGF